MTDVQIAVAVSLTGFSFIMAYISLNLDKRHSILGWFFLPFSIILMFVNVFLLVEYETTGGVQVILSTLGFLLIIAFVFVVFYFILFVITKGFEALMDSPDKKGKDKYKDKLR